MNNYLNSFVGYMDGVVSVFMYRWNKQYKPGQWIRFRVTSDPNLTNVFYMWEDGKKKTVRIFFNQCWFWVRVPKFEEPPTLRVVTEVTSTDGTTREHAHCFKINSME